MPTRSSSHRYGATAASGASSRSAGRCSSAPSITSSHDRERAPRNRSTILSTSVRTARSHHGRRDVIRQCLQLACRARSNRTGGSDDGDAEDRTMAGPHRDERVPARPRCAAGHPSPRRRYRNPHGPPPNPSRCSACFTASLARQCNLFSTSAATASRYSAQPRACGTFVSSTPPTTRPGARLAPPSFSHNVAR